MNFAFAIQASRRSEGRRGEGPRWMVWWIIREGGAAQPGKGGKFVIMERDEENEKANEFDGS